MAQLVKASAYNAGDLGSIPGWRRSLEKESPVFLPGKPHGQRSLIGYSPWGRKGSDTTEQLHFQKFLGREKIGIFGNIRGLKAVIKMSACSLKSFEIAFYLIFMFLLRYFFPE